MTEIVLQVQIKEQRTGNYLPWISHSQLGNITYTVAIPDQLILTEELRDSVHFDGRF